MPKGKSIRKLQLLEANAEDDKVIKKLEKSLKLNKRTKKKKTNDKDGSKKIHSMFKGDGLDYILDVLDSGKGEMLLDSSDEQENTQHSTSLKRKRNSTKTVESSSNAKVDGGNDNSLIDDDNSVIDNDNSASDNDNNTSDDDNNVSDDDNNVSDDDNNNRSDDDDASKSLDNKKVKRTPQKPKIWEDIYGRFRDEKGNVLPNSDFQAGTYVPPAKRLKTELNDNNKKAAVMKIQKQLKGLLNRLSESNMQPIGSQVEEMYMKNSRNDMNDTLMALMSELVFTLTLTPPRLLMEQAMLVSLLHANVGSEVGAYFLQSLAVKINELFQAKGNYGSGKQMNNMLSFFSHLYNFKVTNCLLIFDILQVLTNSFEDKDIELIQLLLRNVGFGLRKDNPLKLKEVIHSIQQKAPSFQSKENSSRVQFMLDTLTAVRNNNVYKVPDYDYTIVDHAKKSLRNMVRTGCSMQELTISFEDLLKAEEKGRWWIVGSAWSSRTPVEENSSQPSSYSNIVPTSVNDDIIELARKQRMNTEIRKTIFCIMITAEDYMDCFEKLLHLNLKNQQEREIINILLHCVLNEKTFNPYYCFLAGKFCKYARKFYMNLQFSLWDKFKEMGSLKSYQIDNLANFLKHLFIKDDLCISVLKVIHFSEMNKTMVRFFRQILQGILLHDSEEICCQVFRRIAPAKNLTLLKEGLRLFMHHFLLRKTSKLDADTVKKLELRIKKVESVLNYTVKL